MATNTYVALKTTTVGTATSSVTLDLTGITGYTDLRAVINGGASGTANVLVRYNGDSTSGLYSYTYLTGDGTSPTSGRATAANQILCNYYGYMDTGFTTNVLIDILQYSNPSVFKTLISRTNNASNGLASVVGLWRNVAAITSVTFVTGSNNFSTGTTFSLYGIAAAGTSPAAKATGGAIYADDTYYYHVFGSTGTFTPLASLSADVLVVAGGGGGGGWNAGGGGAGGLQAFSSQSLTATNYTVTVGAGGAGGTSSASSNGLAGTSGSNSIFGALTASVGGGGGGGHTSSGPGSGLNGGSGGGQADRSGGVVGTATSGQGYAGGSSVDVDDTTDGGGGGGGAGAAGSNGVTNAGGAGGNGLTSSLITAIVNATGIGQLVSTNGYIAGGGGGGAGSNATSGGTGGYGGGSAGTKAATPINATVNTGGGGGGSGGSSGGFTGGAGGSGVVIVKYLKV